MLTCPPQDSVSFPSCNAFQPICYSLKFKMGVEKDVNVIGHNDKRKQRIVSQLVVAATERGHNATSYVRLLQPLWAFTGLVQSAIRPDKVLPRRVFALLAEADKNLFRQRANESPS